MQSTETNESNIHVTADNLIGSLNVSDAKVIYRKAPADSRATWENDYYKLDANDNEVKLVLKGLFPVPTDTTGTLFEEHQVNVALSNLVKLTDRYLMFQPEYESLGLAIDSINGDDPYSVDYRSEYCGLTYLIDIPTEMAYRINAKLDYSEDYLNAQSDGNGNIFFYGSILDNAPFVFKFEPQRTELSTVLTSSQATPDYTVMSNGTLLYGNRALTTGGSIVDFGSSPFFLNGEIYTYEVTKETITYDNHPNTEDIYIVDSEKLIIYRWDRLDSGDLVKTKVDETQNEDNNSGVYYQSTGSKPIQTNPKKDKVYISTYSQCLSPNYVDGGNAFEFDGEKITIRYDLDEWKRNPGISTSEAEYEWQKGLAGGSSNSFMKFDFNTETFYYISFSGYDFYTIQADSNSPNLTFSGMRLNDQKSVAGYITPTDELVITAEDESGLQYISLITL